MKKYILYTVKGQNSGEDEEILFETTNRDGAIKARDAYNAQAGKNINCDPMYSWIESKEYEQ